MWWYRFDVDAEMNKVDETAKAAPAASDQKKSSKPAVSDKVETAGLYVIFFVVMFTCAIVYPDTCLSAALWRICLWFCRNILHSSLASVIAILTANCIFENF